MFSKALICLLPLALFVVAEEVADKENPLELKDVVISDNTVGGDINVNGGGGGSSNGGNTGGGEIGGGDTESFDDGCAVSGDTVQECDGTQRLMTRVEKKKVTARIARRQRQRKAKSANRSRANRSRTNRSKTRRDLEDGEGGDESPCQTCSTGASYAKKNKRKNNRKH